MTFEEWWGFYRTQILDDLECEGAYEAFGAVWKSAQYHALKDEQGKQLVGAHGSLMDRLESQSEGAD